MPVLEDSFYYSNIRSGLHGETENEREVLVQEQRYCRARARKLFLETNRRRKALEERRKQWDVQEQRLRENILQQRHQRVQDATENFQRAHLSPSQRKTPASVKRRTPNLDEALHHIQGSPLLYTHQSQLLPSASTTSRSCTSSPKPSGGARHLRALSAAEAYTKLLQESSLTNFRNNQPFFLNEQQETQTDLKERQQADPQEYLDTPHSETESLSSLDSLENGEAQKSPDTAPVCCSQQSTTCAQSFYLPVDPSNLKHPRRPQSPLRQPDNPCSPSQPSSSIAKSFLEDILNQESKLNPSSLSPRDHESAEENRSLRNLTQERFDNSKDQSQILDAQSTLGCQKELTHQDFAHVITHDNDRSAQGNILKDKGSCARAVPDNTPLESSSLTKDLKSESKQQTRTLEEKYAKHLSEAQTALPASRYKHSSSSFKAFSSSAAHLSITYRADLSSLSMQPIEALSSSQSHKHDPDVDDATGLKRESKPLSIEESISTHPSDPKNETDVIKLAKAGMLKTTEEPNRTSADPVTDSVPNNNVRFLKGILKNHLKSISGNVKFTYSPGHVLFTKEVAILIKDSVELARAKLNDPEQNRTVKKKLRWFDEVDGVEGVDRVFRDPSRHANLPQQTHKQLSADHSDRVNLLTGVSKNISNKSSAVPAGPQSARQAWTEVGPQEIRTQEPTSQRRALCIGGSRIPRRARSARVGSGPVTSRARKGTIIRPQSAREAQHVAKAQGKILVPRPPPKPDVVECDLAEGPVYISKASCCDDGVQSRPGLQDLALYKDTPDSQTVVHRPTLRTDAICAPAPPYCTYTHETGICSLSPPDALADNPRRRCGENGICLDRTPTDDEISLLWHGVRSALASKDGDPQSFLAHNGPLSSSPQVSASLSHVTINGDSLISGVKGASRMGGFFLSSVKSPIRRQAMESNMVKNRVSVENSRSAGTTQRKPSFHYQVTVPKTQHPHKNGLVSDTEGPEVSDCAHEVVDCAQTQKSCNGPVGAQSQRIQSVSISALSLEEQRILQSLERLNQRLQYVQDIAGGNPAVRGIFALGPAFNQTGETAGVTTRRRGASADNRSRTQQRY